MDIFKLYGLSSLKKSPNKKKTLYSLRKQSLYSFLKKREREEDSEGRFK